MNNNLKLALAVVVLAGGGAVLWVSQRPMPMGEAQMGAANGGPLADVKVPMQLSSSAEIGKRAFEAKCATCHGANAAGTQGKAPPLVHPYYRPGHHADAAFFLAAQNGVRAHHWRFGDMPPIDGVTKGDIKGIVAYVRALQKENGIN